MSAGSNGNATVKRFEAPLPLAHAKTSATEALDGKPSQERSEKYGANENQGSPNSVHEDANDEGSKMESI